MANEYLRLQDTKINVIKAQNLLAAVEEKRKDNKKTMQSESNVFAELYKAFRDFFSKLGAPTIRKRLLKGEGPAVSSEYNDTMREARDDVNVSYAESDSLGNLLVTNFNYGETERQMLLNKIRKLGSKSIDYSFYATQALGGALYGSDSFTDKSKIDADKTDSEGHPAEISIDQGAVTLRRFQNVDMNQYITNVTGISEGLADWNADSQTGGYEGLYFGYQDEPRPEGGVFHLDYSADGSTVYEIGAPEEDKNPRRMEMFDNNPDTFWEVELISDTVVGYKNKYSGEQITVAEFKELRENETNSTNVDISGDTIVTNEFGSLVESYVPVSEAGDLGYLKVDFTVHLSRLVTINWLTLNPNNFGTENYIDIYSIETSEDGEVFTELDGFDDHEYDITLTSEANEELSDEQVSATLSPDKFKFAGQGIWTFAPRKVRMIRFSLRQTQSYIKEYDILKYRTEQTVTQTTTKKVGGFFGWGASEKTTTQTRVDVREVELPYLEGIVNGYDIMDLELGGESSGSSGTGAMWMFGVQRQTNTTVGTERIVNQWIETRYDKDRFAIGIRDIGMYSYAFDSSSSLVSKPYISPKPVYKVALTVDESIPRIFYTSSGNSGTENDWIKYYISIDDGTSWKRISPTNHKTTISEDGIYDVPEIININSEVSASDRSNPLAYIDSPAPVTAVRVKAVLARPTDILSAETYTPILHQYVLQMYPHGGF